MTLPGEKWGGVVPLKYIMVVFLILFKKMILKKIVLPSNKTSIFGCRIVPLFRIQWNILKRYGIMLQNVKEKNGMNKNKKYKNDVFTINEVVLVRLDSKKSGKKALKRRRVVKEKS